MENPWKEAFLKLEEEVRGFTRDYTMGFDEVEGAFQDGKESAYFNVLDIMTGYKPKED
jgi:hypothetical protein